MNGKNCSNSKNNVGRAYIQKRNYQIDNEVLSELLKQDMLEGGTIIHCHYISPEIYKNGGWINIARTTFLLNTEDNSMLSLVQATNIPIGPEKYYFKKINEKFCFTLFFPVLPESWKSFSLVEITDEPSPVIIHAIEKNKTGIYNVNII